jgi:Phage tail baseplate hub (GPD)
MEHENLTIEIGGSEVDDDTYNDLVSLEVELDEALAGMFRMKLTLLLQPDGLWTYVDDDDLSIWTPVTITAGLEDDAQQLLKGYVTHVKPVFGAGLDDNYLEIWGMDASVLMDRADVLKDWPGKKDSDIANEIFASYGLTTTNIEDTTQVHDEQVSTIIQRETDIQFLKRLALRNGYECFVDGDDGYFRPPQVSDTPQPTLAVQFGDETNVNHFSLEVNALAQSNVQMFQLDRTDKTVLDSSSTPGTQQGLGANGADSYLGSDVPAGVVIIGNVATTGGTEMDALTQGLFNEGEWFVTGEGEVSANEYGNILKPRSTVTIKGIGETHSGIYYVTHVNHVFTSDGYTQKFRVKRNALQPTGDEDFSSDSGDLLGGLI